MVQRFSEEFAERKATKESTKEFEILILESKHEF